MQWPIIILYLLVCLVHAVLVSWLFVLPKYHRERLAFQLGPAPWVWYSRLLLAPKVRVVGRCHLPSSHTGTLYVANHESIVDILVLTDVVRRAFLMKRSVLVTPIGWGTYLAGSIGFDRGSRRGRSGALEQTLEMAKRAMSVIVFPEGTFGHSDGRLREPHLNLLRRAHQEGLSVVPIGHAGTRRALDGQSLPFHRNAEIFVVVEAPLLPTDYPDSDAFAQACWCSVETAVAAARGQVPSGWPYS